MKHWGAFAAGLRRRAKAENPILKTYVREFEQFVVERAPKLLAVVHAIQRTATLRDAEKSTGMANGEFLRYRSDIRLLKDQFLEQPKSFPPTRKLLSSWETPMQPITKVFLREALYE